MVVHFLSSPTMSLPLDYASDSDRDRPCTLPRVACAPETALADPMLQRALLLQASATELAASVPYSHLCKPESGPALNPYASKSLSRKNLITGFAETEYMSPAHFDSLHRSFLRKRPLSPTHPSPIHNALLDTHYQKLDAAVLKTKRQKKGDPAVIDGHNAYRGPWAKYENIHPDPPLDLSDESDHQPAPPPLPAENLSLDPLVHADESTAFHGHSKTDYQGRSYIHVPQDLDVNLLKHPGQQECFIPKKHIHSWKGHDKGISVIRFFPKSGHLLLSASMDSKIMLWDVYHERNLLRSFSGHAKAVRDVAFSGNGHTFLSASYDRMVKLWDTETGTCVSRFTTGKLPYVVKFTPTSGDQNEFLVGTSDKKIVQFDVRSGNIVQEYTHHTGPVNTITFVDDDRRFVTTSDDKSLRAWEYGIPVPIKYIAEPYMHSMPSVVLHPSAKYIACQSLDNQIVVYSASDRFRQQRRKNYRGHNCAGYALQIDISSDGRYLMSGDAGGYACFWDWKTCKMYKKFKAHDSPVISMAWHPQETSKVVTAAWDGLIKYWD
ncbi:Pre-mRNA-processing factor 17 [Neolecta irregularis DAH-3]|uniref:Pre-mRNA-processing factor 17 n=1 Tax=Neolecta irregularis (strain DAH-3) TaxID=1198029 RepID=A0A1U7LL60_NEOID|nr:Pre-mRNA-processing factor 17 [Neolecta irregularis DAH-3]|eukprot:OLL23387.1 Pre-mRNA-processing factor 17 [Neolecta irregularis DAH-3]